MCNILYYYCSSEHGIPDYEDGSCDDIDIFNPNNLSIKSKLNKNYSITFKK